MTNEPAASLPAGVVLSGNEVVTITILILIPAYLSESKMDCTELITLLT
jgi:hypothetical protein